MGKLTVVQRKMLTGLFYIDGWHNRDHLGDADDLVDRGLLTRKPGGDSQRTSFNYEPTPAGLEALQVEGK